MTDAWHRRLTLLHTLMRRGRLATRDAAQIVDVSRDLARGDLEALERYGVPLIREGDGQDRVWVLLDSWRHFGLNVGLQDRLALLFGRELVSSFLHDTQVGDALHKLEARFAALEGSLPVAPDLLARRFHCVHEPEKDYGPFRSTIDQLVRALLESRPTTYAYRSARGEEREYKRVEPLTLLVYKRGLYLVSQRSKQTYLHAVERMTGLQVHDDSVFEYPRPSEYDPRRVLAGRFGISTDGQQPSLVRLRFHASARTYAAARRWMPEQTVTDLPDGGCELSFVAHGHELVSQILEYGPKVEVLEPAWLRDRVISELRSALALYAAESNTCSVRSPAT